MLPEKLVAVTRAGFTWNFREAKRGGTLWRSVCLSGNYSGEIHCIKSCIKGARATFYQVKARRRTRDAKKGKGKKGRKKRRKYSSSFSRVVRVYVGYIGELVYPRFSRMIREWNVTPGTTGESPRSRFALSSIRRTKWRDQTVECIWQHDNCGVKPCTSDRLLSKRSFSFKLSSVSYFFFLFFFPSPVCYSLLVFSISPKNSVAILSLSLSLSLPEKKTNEKRRERERENSSFSLRNGTECYTADEFVQFYQQTEHQLSESWNLQPF